MTFQNWAQKIAGGERERLGVAAVVVIGILVGGFFALGGAAGAPKPAANTLTVPAKTFAASPAPVAETSPVVAASPAAKKTDIVVYVTGAVKRPGVYTLSAGDRLYHAIRAAGGFKANAVQDALNLADRAQDGDQLCVPVRAKAGAKGQSVATVTAPKAAPLPALIRKTPLPVTVALPRDEEGDAPEVTVLPTPAPPARVIGTPVSVVASAPEQAAPDTNPLASNEGDATSRTGKKPKAATKTVSKFKNPGDGVVNINTATDAQFQQLPRCGPAMSAKIIAYRTQIGRFTDLKQLMDVKGVGEKTYEKWQPFLAL
ncbi:MAG: helix-hairpin-helix domain-containing protein [Armatimonadetes bacterium]|nr:helix-hairpin-helix domain-containing protein [Armatimonadota bacterium]